MPIRILAISLLLSGSAFASSDSKVQPRAVVADLAAGASAYEKADDKSGRQAAPRIRVILPSPYQVRAK